MYTRCVCVHVLVHACIPLWGEQCGEVMLRLLRCNQVGMHVCMYLCVRACVRACVPMRVCVFVCVRVCVCVCVCVHMNLECVCVSVCEFLLL
jgi:hypothetical protein